MTGSEAWSLVAPMITPLLAVKNVDTAMVCELYVLIHLALKEYDERRAEQECKRQSSTATE
jgi:hypothetical protein